MKKHTDITIILDRSGSMNRIKTATIAGFNSFIKEHQNLNVRLSLIQFNQEYDISYENKNIENVNNLDDGAYSPQGMTSLLDAIGTTLDNKKKYFKSLLFSQKPENVIIAIITDGLENRSKLYSPNDILLKINKRKIKDNWKFVFLGANQDAIMEGSKLGFSKDWCLDFKASSLGMYHAFNSLTKESKKMIANKHYTTKFSEKDRDIQNE
jgi:Mg-chelatase subunit ChlD